MASNFFTDEILRAYRVLGERAFVQNILDIDSWFYGKLITDIERKELHSMNKDLYRTAL